MIIHNKNAHKYWCPKTQVLGKHTNRETFNASGNNFDTCLGSQCMAWVNDSRYKSDDGYGHCGFVNDWKAK